MAPTRSTRSGAAAAKRSAHWRQRSRPLRNRSGYSSVIGRPDHCLSAISWGTLANRVLLQNLGVEVLVVIADYENLADRNAPETVPREVLAHIADYLAVGSTRSRLLRHQPPTARRVRPRICARHGMRLSEESRFGS